MKKRLLSTLCAVSLGLCSVSTLLALAEDADTFRVSGIVWDDEDKNGEHDEGAAYDMDGLNITVLNAAANREVTSATTEDGHFSFSLPAGDYNIRIALPSGYEYYNVISTEPSYGTTSYAQRIGSSTVYEFPFSSLAGFSYSLEVAVSEMDPSWLDGYVWVDINGNGVRPDYDNELGEAPTESDSEKGISGAILVARGENGTVFATTTDGSGYYGFEVPAGEYTLTARVPESYTKYVPTNTNEALAYINATEGNVETDFGFVHDETTDRDYTETVVPPNSPYSHKTPVNRPSRATPEPTEEPDDNDDETNTSLSKSTSKPSATTDPSATANPDATDEPYTTDDPTATDDPDATVRPRTTLKPSPTAKALDGSSSASGGELSPSSSPSPLPSPSATPDTAPKPRLNKADHSAYISGYEDGTIRPENNITRQETAAIFFRLLTEESRDYYMSENNIFSDVPASAWSNTAISTMAKAGIINGYGNSSFMPQKNITRAEFAAIASSFSEKSYVSGSNFSDIGGHWAVDSISDAAGNGWISGYDDGSFRPDAYITRAEAITIVNNMLERSADTDSYTVTWPDNTPDKWYYSAVQDATNSY